MLFLIFAIPIGGCGAFVALFAIFTMFSNAARAARADGQREAFKLAIDIAHDRADIAVCTAPQGDLQTGLVRSQVAHSIEMELRAALAEIR